MSSGSSSKRSGRQTMRTLAFGRNHVVRPRGIHQATIVWLHGHGENGSIWSQYLEGLALPNWGRMYYCKRARITKRSTWRNIKTIKWICPTAPTRSLAAYGGYLCPAWFDAKEFSEDEPESLEELDASAMHVAGLLSNEPADVKLGIGGFSMGAATALYCAMCHCLQHKVNGNLYQINLQSIVAISGWLPCSRLMRRSMEGSSEAIRRAASLPTMICHGTGDDQVAYMLGEKSAQALKASGFQNLVFRRYEELGHYHSPEEIHEVCCWLTATLELDGPHV